MGILVLVARLIELQIIKGGYYRSLADGNRIRRVPIFAHRGKILARGGEILITSQEIKKKVIFDPEIGYKKVEFNENVVEEDVIEESARVYELGDKFSHAGGYIGETNAREVGKVDADCTQNGPRKIGSLVGRAGLEQKYDCALRGFDGELLIEVDTRGKKVRILGKKDPVSGQDITTTIDYELQKKVGEVMGDKNGAVVASSGNGEILAIFSSPSFDPANVGKYLADKRLPLFDRAISGMFHPGSVFKIVTAIAALGEGKIDKNYKYEDPGVIKIKIFTYSNWFFTQYGKTEGVIDLTRALARSTDTFFYKIGEITGVDNLVLWAKSFGLGEITNIDLPGETPGLVPDPLWKIKTKGEPWFLGNTYHMSIGQGDLAATPIQVNLMTSVIASGGKLCKPHLKEGRPKACSDLKIGAENLELVKKGMEGACQTGGTAFPFFGLNASLPAGRQVACKTGTAETDEVGSTHAWITLFAPSDFPEIVLTVLIEKGGEGAFVAAPIAKEILESWQTLRY